MKDEIKDIFINRNTISKNVDKLVKYGVKHQKSSSSGQMSLFDSESVEIDKVSLEQYELSQAELINMSEKEAELIGFPLTYDEFSEFILIDKTLCNSTLKEVVSLVNSTDYKVILAKVTKLELKTSKAGNKYYKVHLNRDGIDTFVYLFGRDIPSNLKDIHPGEIHLLRLMMAGDTISLKKIQSCKSIDVNTYIDNINICLRDDLRDIDKIRNYVYFKMKYDNGVNLKYIFKDELLITNETKVIITAENCNHLIDLGCKIIVNRKI